MNIKEKESKLITLLKEDKTLDDKLKLEYIAMAKEFLKDFSTNIYCTSIELNDKLPLGIDTWKDFLSIGVVKKYIKSFKDEKINKSIDQGLIAGESSAINLKKNMDANGPSVNNSNVILIRLPEKVEWD